MHRLLLSASSLLIASATSLHADWPAIHRGADNNAYVPAAALVTNLATASESWSTGAENIFTGARPIIVGGSVYTVCHYYGPDRVTVKAFNRTTGVEQWESPNLSLGNTVSFGSASTLLASGGALYIGTGTALQKLNPVDGSVTWSTTFTASSTDATGVYTIVNSSPAGGDGRVYIATADFGSGGAQVVAVDQTTGNVSWFRKTGGVGVQTPLYYENGATKLVITDTITGGNAGALALDATTGNVVWSHATVSSPWNTGGNQFYGDFVLSGATAYGFSYDFMSATSNLVSFNVETGALNYSQPGLSTDCVPVLVSGVLYGVGGTYGNASVAAYNPATGAENYRVALNGGGNYIFRNYIAATNSGLFVANDIGFPAVPNTQLLLIDPATGATTSATPASAANNYTGAVSVDDDGAIFVAARDGSLRAFLGSTNVADWTAFE